MLIANIALIVSYFNGWAKFSGSASVVAGIISHLFGYEFKPISPNYFFTVLSEAKSVASLFGELPIYYNLFYLLLLIPIPAGISIILSLTKNKLAKIFTICSSVICLLWTSVFLISLFSGEGGSPTVGLFIAIAAGIYGIIASTGYLRENR